MQKFKRGNIIVDTCNPNDKTHYLILTEKENSYYCIDTIDLKPVTISKDWINQYAIVECIDFSKIGYKYYIEGIND